MTTRTIFRQGTNKAVPRNSKQRVDEQLKLTCCLYGIQHQCKQPRPLPGCKNQDHGAWAIPKLADRRINKKRSETNQHVCWGGGRLTGNEWTWILNSMVPGARRMLEYSPHLWGGDSVTVTKVTTQVGKSSHSSYRSLGLSHHHVHLNQSHTSFRPMIPGQSQYCEHLIDQE